MRIRFGVKTILFGIAVFGFLSATEAQRAPVVWNAAADEARPAQSKQGALFSLAIAGATCTITLDYAARRIEISLPTEALPKLMPLAGRVRLSAPTFGKAPASPPIFVNNGWSIWANRPIDVRAAGRGTVVASGKDPIHGPSIEIDHGSGLRTRYFLNSYGKAMVTVGARVEAGDKIGELGAGLPDDIPFVHFGVLLDLGETGVLALDPAPFLLGAGAEGRAPLATSVLNAAIRGEDVEQVRRLLAVGLDPNGRAGDDTIPLEWAVMIQNVELAKILVDGGADPTAPTAYKISPYILNSGPTILEMAEDSRNRELIAVLSKN